ncbi:MAG: ABC transporter substrate-binding protein [Clostridia bacterium]|nr:ABC transporter substrate-binding protein [Clostridia bacterium]
MSKKLFLKVVTLMLAGMMLFSFVGCGKVDTMKKVKDSGKIILGTSADYPPYEFHKSINGKDEIIGFDISVAKEIAKDLGVEFEIKEMDFEGLLAALQTGKVDYVIAGMTPTEERMKQVDFTKIYYRAQQGIVVRTEDKDKIKSLEDLKSKKVGVQKGSTQEEIAKEQIKDAELKSLGKVSDLVLELKNKKVDAVVMELPVAAAYINKNQDIVISDIKVSDDVGGSAVAVAKDNSELVEAMNKTIDRITLDKSLERFVKEASDASIESN